MKKKLLLMITLLLLPAMLLSACSPTDRLRDLLSQATDVLSSRQAGEEEAEATAVPEAEVSSPSSATDDSSRVVTTSGDVLTALQDTLGQIYEIVNPSVVYIQVTLRSEMPSLGNFEWPEGFGVPEQFDSSAQASGFVWDEEGHIVTNNHVVEDATGITVVFSDGTTLDAEVVGTDPDSDLAVIRVDATPELLQPVRLSDSNDVKVGQLAVAIGNPFGLEGTMTVGFVSAIGRSIPVTTRTAIGGARFSIPDIIQTDAPINPGNSGGVLVNDDGQVIGVPTAIETSSGQNAGIGYAVPSAIVQQVVPSLIADGTVQHPWIGISGTSLNSVLAEAMGLDAGQRGALVLTVTGGSPAEAAGLRGSTRTVEINGQEAQVGGDVIVGIGDRAVDEFDDLISYLAQSVGVGDTITLTLLRDGQETKVDVTLAARPTDTALEATGEQEPGGETTGSAWLGIEGVTLSPALAQAMELDQGLAGVLVVSIVAGSPADDAGLRGGGTSATIDGQSIKIGGDIIIAIDDEGIAGLEDLQTFLAGARPGQQVTLTVLRNGTREGTIDVTLGVRPSSIQ
jgi:S1-C subfamily serine protease